jgi:hypothetical protein
MLSDHRAGIDSSLGCCLADQAGKHIDCGVEAHHLVVRPRPARVSEQLPIVG